MNNFVVVRLPSPHNGIIGRPGVRMLQPVPSIAHGMLKLPVEGGVITQKSSKMVPLECAMVSGPEGNPLVTKQIVEERFKVAINPEYPEQTIMIGTTLTEEGHSKLCDLLQRNLDIFAWKPTDMTGIPRHITEHHMNVWEGCSPIRQKKRRQAADRNQAIQEEVGKLWEDMRRFQGLKQSMPKRWLSTTENRLEGGILVRIPFQMLLRRIQRLSPNTNGKRRYRKNSVHYKPRNILLYKDAFRSEKYQSNLPMSGG
ncbi:hypothetical protein Tco_0548380 [Tanacetum coccineum]